MKIYWYRNSKNLIGHRLHDLRISQHLTQRQLAARMQLAGMEMNEVTILRKKLARARAFQKERSGESEEAPEEGIPLEKHDVSTMIFSALLTIVPICLGILLLMGFLLLLIFRAL